MGNGLSVEETGPIIQCSERAEIAISARENPNAKLDRIIGQGLASAQGQPLPSESGKATFCELYSTLQSGTLNSLRRRLEEDQENTLLDQVTPQQNTALHIVARLGLNEQLSYIVERRHRLITQSNSNKDLPLHLAAAAGHLSTVKAIVYFAREWSMTGDMFQMKNRDGDSALHVAVRNKREDVALFLIQEFSEGSYSLNEKKESPLFLAAEAGSLELVNRMICNPITTDLQSTLSRDKSVVHAAITGDNLHVLEAILSRYPFLISSTELVTDKASVFPLSYAAYKGNLDMVHYMLHRFPDSLSKMDPSGTFPIHLAAVKGHKMVIEEFLKFRPDSRELLTRNGENILHIAAKSGHDHVVRYLLSKSDLDELINARDNKGNTPLHLATSYGYPQVVDTLIWNKRVKPDAVNDDGMAAIDIALSYEHAIPTFKELLTWLALHYAGASRVKYPLKRSWTLSDTSNMKSFKDKPGTLLLVATIVTTMSFAAGFQMPGGTADGNRFLKRPLFQVFLVTNSMAFYASILSMLIFLFALLDDINLIRVSLRFGEPVLAVSLVMVSMAFMSAAYLVVSSIKWLGLVVWVLGFVFLAVVIPLFFVLFPRVYPKKRLIRFILRLPFRAMAYVSKWE